MLTTLADAQVQAFDWGRIEWLVSRAIGNSDTLTVGRVTIAAGKQNMVHRHPNCDEVLHLLAGCLEHRLDEQLYLMHPGDSLVIPAGDWHNACSTGPDDAIMLVCYSSADRQTEMLGSDT